MADDPEATPTTKTPRERIALLYERLDALPPARNASEAMEQVADTLNGVEDEYSGVPKNPNPGLKFDGRMYPPRDDYTTETEDGGLVASTKGHRISAGPDGSLRLENRKSGEVEFEKAGAGAAAPEVSRTRSQNREQGTAAEAQDSGTAPSAQSLLNTGSGRRPTSPRATTAPGRGQSKGERPATVQRDPGQDKPGMER